jgi:hypothetical protein
VLPGNHLPLLRRPDGAAGRSRERAHDVLRESSLLANDLNIADVLERTLVVLKEEVNGNEGSV